MKGLLAICVCLQPNAKDIKGFSGLNGWAGELLTIKPSPHHSITFNFHRGKRELF